MKTLITGRTSIRCNDPFFWCIYDSWKIYVNSLWSNDTICHHRYFSIMACCLFGTKPLSETMLQLTVNWTPSRHFSKISTEIWNISSKFCLQNVGHFVQVLMHEKIWCCIWTLFSPIDCISLCSWPSSPFCANTAFLEANAISRQIRQRCSWII